MLCSWNGALSPSRWPLRLVAAFPARWPLWLVAAFPSRWPLRLVAASPSRRALRLVAVRYYDRLLNDILAHRVSRPTRVVDKRTYSGERKRSRGNDVGSEGEQRSAHSVMKSAGRVLSWSRGVYENAEFVIHSLTHLIHFPRGSPLSSSTSRQLDRMLDVVGPTSAAFWNCEGTCSVTNGHG
jgi:hypothetical protein